VRTPPTESYHDSFDAITGSLRAQACDTHMGAARLHNLCDEASLVKARTHLYRANPSDCSALLLAHGGAWITLLYIPGTKALFAHTTRALNSKVKAKVLLLVETGHTLETVNHVAHRKQEHEATLAVHFITLMSIHAKQEGPLRVICPYQLATSVTQVYALLSDTTLDKALIHHTARSGGLVATAGASQQHITGLKAGGELRALTSVEITLALNTASPGCIPYPLVEITRLASVLRGDGAHEDFSFEEHHQGCFQERTRQQDPIPPRGDPQVRARQVRTPPSLAQPRSQDFRSHLPSKPVLLRYAPRQTRAHAVRRSLDWTPPDTSRAPADQLRSKP
jgi:hypothetical protein